MVVAPVEEKSTVPSTLNIHRTFLIIVVIFEKIVPLVSEVVIAVASTHEVGDAASLDVYPIRVPSLEGDISYVVVPILTLSTEAII